MELFRVVDIKSLEVLKGFNNKMEAKSFRDSLTMVGGIGYHCVSLGKDHARFKGRNMQFKGRNNHV
jgi:hypothetical protein